MGRRKSFTEVAGTGPMNVTDAVTAAPTQVAVSACVARPDNPRPANPDVSELAASVRELGQIQPATVASRAAYLQHRPDHAAAVGDASWVVLAGNRRLAACREAGVANLLVHVADDRVSEIIELGIIENVQREPLTPVREAAELQQLLDRYGTTRAVAERIGKTHVYVSQRVSLLKLVPQLQAAVDEGRLKVSDGRELAKIPQHQQLGVYEAGPPYRFQKRSTSPPADGVLPGEPATYTRTELDSGNTVSKPVGGSGADGDGQMLGNTVSNKSLNGAPPEQGNSETTSRTPATAVVEFSASSGRMLPARPADLVAAIEREYTDEERHEVLRLLRQ